MKEGWKKYNLMDICNVTTGKHDANHAEENGKYRFYTCSSQYVYCNTKRYEGECIILPGNGVNVGESYYFNGEFDAYQRTYVIDKIDKRIIPMFLYYHLQNNWKSEGVAKQYGSATNYIKIGNFKDYIVKSPQSLSEQQAIVDYLDSAFAKIDAMKANAEKALNEAKALFQASLKEMLEPKEGWEEKKLGDICSDIRYGTSTPSNENGEYKYLRMNNITNDGFLDVSHYKTISLPEKELEKCLVKRGDIIFNRTNSRELVGKSCVFTEDENMVIAGYLIRIRLRDGFEPQFITYSMNLQRSLGLFQHLIVGAVHQANISANNIQKVIINYPSLSEQLSIVATLGSLKSKVDRLQANYDKISQECDALKQAILRQVFE